MAGKRWQPDNGTNREPENRMNNCPKIVLPASCESDGAENYQNDFFTESLTGTFKHVLQNPGLASEFYLLDFVPVEKSKWGFANRNPVTFATAMEGSQSCNPIGIS